MLSRYSVKRPLTVIMIVILVIILGVISFTNMTTDLLPNMDFPYVVMYTSFPGASPEKIETMVTKPLESAVSTLSGIESVQSVSYENVSLIIIEFSYGVNMDSVLIELSSRVDLVKASLDSNVGTPVYMKINPDMLPVMVLSAGVRDMDEIAASDFVTENVVPAIERVNGVATVSTAGLLKEEIRVTLSSSKIDALNDRILGAVDSELLEVQKQLRDARKELEEKKKQFETESKSQLDELNSAESAVADGYAQINEGYAQLDATYASLTAQLNELKTKRAQLVDLIDGVNNMETLENTLRLAEAAVSEAEKQKEEKIPQEKHLAGEERNLLSLHEITRGLPDPYIPGGAPHLRRTKPERFRGRRTQGGSLYIPSPGGAGGGSRKCRNSENPKRGCSKSVRKDSYKGRVYGDDREKLSGVRT